MQAKKKTILSLLIALGLCAAVPATASDPVVVVVVAHPDTPVLNEDTLKKIYLGKVVEVNGRSVVPVNLVKGNVLRKEFIEKVVGMDDDKYVAYWTVRRYIGKGSPPREFAAIQEQREFLRTTPSSVGYQDESADIKQDVKMILKKP